MDKIDAYNAQLANLARIDAKLAAAQKRLGELGDTEYVNKAAGARRDVQNTSQSLKVGLSMLKHFVQGKLFR